MHLSLWKPISRCASIIIDSSKSRRGDGSGFGSRSGTVSGKSKNSIMGHMKENKAIEALEEKEEEVLEDESVATKSKKDTDLGFLKEKNGNLERSRSLARLQSQEEFLIATALFANQSFSSQDSIPEFSDAFNKFLTVYPKYQSSEKIDQLRSDEYSHLSDADAKVCLDYCGFGLFSYLQTLEFWDSSAFNLKEITANLSNHALHGGAEEGTAEHDIKSRIMEYLNIPENEYGLVFTVSRGSAFKLLAESYPFHSNKRLLTMFDHESQSVNWMAQCAKEKGAKVHSAWFKWPSLKVCSKELRKQISNKKKKKKKKKRDSAVGLFVFPVQSRVTGSKYSYQWMALAQQHNWHVLLDAGSLGPKDMDSLGLSLFRPDFIITSFYKVFGYDPTGFGCLLIKKSVMGTLQNKSGHTGSGIVRIIPDYPQYLGDSLDCLDELVGMEEKAVQIPEEKEPEKPEGGPKLPAFSGIFTASQIRDVFDTEVDQDSSLDKDGISTAFEDTDSISVGEVMRSPVFSEDESCDNMYWIDLGQSPFESDKYSQFSKQKSLSPSRFSGKKINARQFSSKLTSNYFESPAAGDIERINPKNHENTVLSFDEAVMSVSKDFDRIKGIPEEESMLPEPDTTNLEKLGSNADNKNIGEIQEEAEITLESSSSACSTRWSFVSNGGNEIKNLRSALYTETEGSAIYCHERKESAIRRETEGNFRLLERRERNHYNGSRFFGLENGDRIGSLGLDGNQKQNSGISFQSLEGSGSVLHDNESGNDEEEWNRREPEILCSHLDHVNMLGLNRTTLRLRYLINWLITSLLHLRFPNSSKGAGIPLVQVYGPKIKQDRGAAIAFNIRTSSKGGAMVHPELVQKLADRNGISLSVGILGHVWLLDSSKQVNRELGMIQDMGFCKPVPKNCQQNKDLLARIEVVTASLGFLTNFEDVYKLWSFVAKFLDPSFVEQNGSTPL